MLSAALKTAAAAALGLAVLGAPVAAGAATGTSGGTWLAAQPFPGFSASNATLQAISCPSAGNCAAVGYTSVGSTTTPIVSAETNGVWGGAQVISGTGSLGNGSGGMLTKVSCGGPGDCAATGTYNSINGPSSFYVSETAGKWGTAAPVTSADQPAGTYSEVNALSCGAAGYCAIVGRYTDDGAHVAGTTISTPFTLDQARGAWGTPQPVPGLAALPASGSLSTLDSVSCTGDSDCTASGEGDLTFVVSETGGTWGNAEQLPGTFSADYTTISCPDPADCTVAALVGQTIFTYDEADSAWGQPHELAMPSSTMDITNDPLLGCRSAGNCVILDNMDFQVGTGVDAKGTSGPFAATETTSGAWGAGATLPGIPPATEVGMGEGLSCVPGGDCTLVGSAQADTGTPAYLWAGFSGANGSIGTVQQVYAGADPNPVVGLSCPQDGRCTLAAELDYKYVLGTETTASATYSGTIRLSKMGYCLDDRNNSSSNGAVVQVWKCNGGASQGWQVMSDGTIRHNGLCLDAVGSGTANGTKVQLWACTGHGNQQWDTKGFRVHYDNPAASGKVLDDTGSGGNGTRQQIWANTGAANQIWVTS